MSDNGEHWDAFDPGAATPLSPQDQEWEDEADEDWEGEEEEAEQSQESQTSSKRGSRGGKGSKGDKGGKGTKARGSLPKTPRFSGNDQDSPSLKWFLNKSYTTRFCVDGQPSLKITHRWMSVST